MIFHSFNSVGFRYYLFMSVLMLTMYIHKDTISIFLMNDLGIMMDISLILLTVNIIMLVMIPLIAMIKDTIEDIRSVERMYTFPNSMVDPYMQWKIEQRYKQ